MSTVDERRAQREYDQKHPWRPISEAKPDGRISELQFSDMGGEFSSAPVVYFLGFDGRTWHKVEDGSRLLHLRGPMNWRPLPGAVLSEQRRRELIQQERRRDEDMGVWQARDIDREMDRER